MTLTTRQRKLARFFSGWAAIITTAYLVYMGLSSGETLPTLGLTNNQFLAWKIEGHLMGFVACSAATYIAARIWLNPEVSGRQWTIVGIYAVLGAVIEGLQFFTPAHTPLPQDVGIDLLGAIIGTSVVRLVLRYPIGSLVTGWGTTLAILCLLMARSSASFGA